MSTEINVTVGPPTLRQQNRQQIDANRFRRAEQDAQQRTEATARIARQQQLDQQGLTADGQQRYGDPLQARFRRQKPAAFRFQTGRRFGLASWGYRLLPFPDWRWTWEARCGDYSQTLNGFTGYTQIAFDGFPAYRAFILPVKGENGILVLQLISQSEFRFNAAFAVNSTKIRSIPVPNTLEEVLSYVPRLGNGFNDSAIGYYEPLFDFEFTPTIFETLNNYSQFVAPSSLKQFPSSKNPVTRDYRFGFYSNISNQQDPAFYFAEWVNGNYYTSPAWQLQSVIKAPSFVYDPPYTYDRFFWDWDDPDYCRRLCKALGFSDADLTP